ncbi:DnaT-like ssDNA-binding domain-containing protein [Alteromonas halophila]|uniref:DnaT DNA-binding domain-containing protein n=1 Tax=Alteromonas halophila TaxID=516698 RepID=A0A918N106_9ALTE|nr:DnaT-like ssDNA-binding domain-containing protein [Alteromonas halophila]GGW96449.1 hypothetical protein GCM10007391_33210 [Alteromonas halophila]
MTLNDAERAALHIPLANDARVLYCLGLRPDANEKTGASAPLDYRALLTLLNADNKDAPYQRGRQINSLLKQLDSAGLVTLVSGTDFEHSLNGQQVMLPLCKLAQSAFETLHSTHTGMTRHWQPDNALYKELTALMGVIDSDFDDQDVGEFVAYWLGRPDAVFSLFQWTQKFAYSMRKKRLAAGYVPTRRVGNQTTKVAAGVEADDNARKLVEKYAAKKPES